MIILTAASPNYKLKASDRTIININLFIFIIFGILAPFYVTGFTLFIIYVTHIHQTYRFVTLHVPLNIVSTLFYDIEKYLKVWYTHIYLK